MVRTLQENSKQLNERLDKAAAVIKDVGKEVGEMSEIGRSMRELQEFLKSPKLRGNIGEQILKDLISQIFPKNSFHLQYAFKSGEKVDAAIKTDAGILPSESVFYEIVNTDDLIEYARNQRVYIVSPTTLYAHLQTILLSFEGKKIETQSREVLR